MSRYLIPGLKKLVDASQKGRITDDYNTKATELENAWVAQDGGVQKRPGLKEAPYSGLPGILDVKYTKDRIYVLREAKLGPLGNLIEYLRAVSYTHLTLPTKA